MTSTARHHHYIPQCYLKGFTKSGAKKSKLHVFDLRRNSRFETTTRNVGGRRDFNRVEIEGASPDAFESSLSEFEGELAAALKGLAEDPVFEGDKKDYVLNLVALMAVRSPQMREHFRKFIASVAEQMMDMSLATEERWNSLREQMQQDGHEVGDLSYDEIKRFNDSRKFTISVRREFHIYAELKGMQSVLETLHARNWLLVLMTEDSGPFITSDCPVMLVWREAKEVPPAFRHSPGHSLKGTRVTFPVSRNAALVGEFDGNEGTVEGPNDLVAALNANTLTLAHEQVFSPKGTFKMIDTNGGIQDGATFIRRLHATR